MASSHNIIFVRWRSHTDAEVVAIADLREEVAQRTAEQFGIDRVYSNPYDLIADPQVEGIIVCFPPAGRLEVVLAALQAGKHVLLEKPVAYNAKEVEAYIAARGDLVVGCCSGRVRLTRTAREATAFIASGALGEIRTLRVRVAPTCRTCASVAAASMAFEPRHQRWWDHDELGLLRP